MKFNTVYNICLSCILLVFFLVAYVLGTIICAKEESNDAIAAPQQSNEIEEYYDTQSSEEKNLSQAEESVFEESVEPKYYDIELSDGEQDYVFELCTEYGVPCELVLAVMNMESNYEAGQVSENSDWGVMQINEINHDMLRDRLGVTDFLDFKQNVLCGVYMLSEYYHKYADINKITMCYRYGESGAQAMWEKGITSTDYSAGVVRNIAALKYR